MENKLVSEMLMEYSKEKGLSYSDDDEGIFNILAIAREILDLDYLYDNGEEVAIESLVASPFCVVLMLVRTIELLQEEKATYTITADGAQLLSVETMLEELEIVFKDITDASLKVGDVCRVLVNSPNLANLSKGEEVTVANVLKGTVEVLDKCGENWYVDPDKIEPIGR